MKHDNSDLVQHRKLASARIRGFCDYFSASLGLTTPDAFADLGVGVMDDAAVEAAAYVLEKAA